MKRQFQIGMTCLASLLFSVPARTQPVQAVVVEGGTLIDGNGGPPIEDAVIVMNGSRIKAVGIKGKVSYPANARVIHAAGKFIIPGLIDVDIHYRGWDPQMFLHYGVTTVCEPSTPTDWVIVQRDMINHGKIKGPRMFVSGNPISGPRELSRLGSAPEQGGGIIHVTTPEEARRAVRLNAAAGVDLIHVEESLTPELLKAVVEEARKHRLPVYGHSTDIREATLAGLKYMEHSVPLSHSVIEAEDPKKLDKFDWKNVEFPGAEYEMNPKFYGPIIKLMVSNGVFINPTFAMEWRAASPRAAEWSAVAAEIIKEPGIEFVPAELRQQWATLAPRKPTQPLDQFTDGFKKLQEFTREYVQAGGKALVGTDSLAPSLLQGVSVSFEMQMLVDAGATPMQAIMAATKNSAEMAYKDKELGTIEPGKLGDLIVVESDPLKDIAAVRKIAVVVKDGQVIDTNYDAKFVNPIPRIPLNGQLTGPANGPELLTVVPTVAPEGDKEVTIKLAGKRFSPHSVVRFGTTDLKTEFVNKSSLTAVIPKAKMRTVGSYVITVVNPDSAVTSNLRYFIVNFKY